MNDTNKKTLASTIEAIQALDLTPIKFKATRKEDGYGWSSAYADKMEIAYKRYLILNAKYPSLVLAPDQEIDRFWHMHILDTRKYAADCEATFGYFLHHFPYLGLRGEDDAKALGSAFSAMQELYVQEFGEAMPHGGSDAAWCGAEVSPHAAWCGADKPAQTNAAWCGADKPAKAAWCGADKPAKAAWCGADSPAQAKAAWCGADKPAANTKAAWCGADKPAQAAWCGADKPTQAAWCGAESMGTAKAAWCGAESPSKAAEPAAASQ